MLLRLFDRDDAVLADLLHGVGQEVADGDVVVRRNRADLRDLFTAGDRLRVFFKLFDDRLYRQVDAPLERHRVRAGSDVLDAEMGDHLRQDRCGGGPVTGHVRGLGGDLLDHLCAHVFELFLKLHLFCHGHAVLGDGRRAPAFFQHHVAAPRAERDFHRVCEDIDPFQEFLPRRDVEQQAFLLP